jgi:hypothetical protein
MTSALTPISLVTKPKPIFKQKKGKEVKSISIVLSNMIKAKEDKKFEEKHDKVNKRNKRHIESKLLSVDVPAVTA